MCVHVVFSISVYPTDTQLHQLLLHTLHVVCAFVTLGEEASVILAKSGLAKAVLAQIW